MASSAKNWQSQPDVALVRAPQRNVVARGGIILHFSGLLPRRFRIGTPAPSWSLSLPTKATAPAAHPLKLFEMS